MSGNVSIHAVDDTNTMSGGSAKVKWIPVKVDPNGNLKISLGTRLAGERIEESTTGSDYMSVSEEYEATTNDVSNDSTTIYSGPAICAGVYINTVLSAHTVVLQDNATAKVTIPASAAAGTLYTFPPFRCLTSLVCNPNDASTGNITIFWRPLDPSVTWS